MRCDEATYRVDDLPAVSVSSCSLRRSVHHLSHVIPDNAVSCRVMSCHNSNTIEYKPPTIVLLNNTLKEDSGGTRGEEERV